MLDQFARPSLPLLLILAAWACLRAVGQAELTRLRRLTVQLALAELHRHPHLNDRQIFHLLLPNWERQVRCALFWLPDRSGWLILPAGPQAAANHLVFGPQWIAALRASRLSMIPTERCTDETSC